MGFNDFGHSVIKVSSLITGYQRTASSQRSLMCFSYLKNIGYSLKKKKPSDKKKKKKPHTLLTTAVYRVIFCCLQLVRTVALASGKAGPRC